MAAINTLLQDHRFLSQLTLALDSEFLPIAERNNFVQNIAMSDIVITCIFSPN